MFHSGHRDFDNYTSRNNFFSFYSSDQRKNKHEDRRQKVDATWGQNDQPAKGGVLPGGIQSGKKASY